MKKTFSLAALLCLLFVSAAVFGQNNYVEPKAREGLVYNGSIHYLLTPGDNLGHTNLHFFYLDPTTNNWSDDPANIPGGRYPGEYTVSWTLINGDQDPNKIPAEELRIKEEKVTISPLERPQPRLGLVYAYNDWQELVDPTHKGVALGNDAYYFRISPESRWSTAIPSAIDAGTYHVEYILWDGSNAPEEDWLPDGEFDVVISDPAADPTKTQEPTTPAETQIPTTPAETQIPTTPAETQIPTTPAETQMPTVPAVTLVPTIPAETQMPQPPIIITPDHSVRLPIPLYRIGDGSGLFTDNLNLPATGFPTRFNKPLAVKPSNINYESLAMRIQIPVINVDVELTGVPEVEGTWAVEWLGYQAGLLSGSAMPGEGHAMIAAHNHLNMEEMGPFALLSLLENNDRIFINAPDGGLQIYSVYANELLVPDDIEKMESIAKTESNSIILVTCENEMIDGGYMNRRTVFAKPVAVK